MRPRRLHKALAEHYVVAQVIDADRQALKRNLRRRRSQVRQRRLIRRSAQPKDRKSRHSGRFKIRKLLITTYISRLTRASGRLKLPRLRAVGSRWGECVVGILPGALAHGAGVHCQRANAYCWLFIRAASNSSPFCHPISLVMLAASHPRAKPKRAMAESPVKSISGWYSSLGW